MLILYTREGCGYSAMVKDKLLALGLTAEEKNTRDDGIAQELIARGGELKTPYLVDDATGAEMYESGLICSYLEEQYGKK